MTVVTSRFWDGTEYDDDDIAEVFANTLGSFVIPGKINSTKGDELRISTSAVAGNVTIQPGAAMVYGTYYQTDAEVEVTLTAALGFHLIVLRRDSITNQVRYAIISDTASPPAIPRPVDGTDLPLGLVYGQTLVAVPIEDIRDVRQFFQTGFQRELSNYENLMDNVEFYGHSGGSNIAPDGWKLVNTPTITYGTSYDRGNFVTITSATQEGIRKVVPVGTYNDDGTLFTFTSEHIQVTNDSLLNIYTMIANGTETLIKTVHLWNSSSQIPIVERFSVQSDDVAVIIEFQTKNAGSSDSFTIGNIGLYRGYIPVDPRWNHEVVWYDYNIIDASWNLNPYSTANNTIDLTASFANCNAVGARGVIARFIIRDSGSAAAADNGTACLIYHIDQTAGTDPYLVAVSCAGLPNNKSTAKVVWIPLDPGSTNPSFIVRTVASGAGTLDVQIYLIGIVT